MSEPQPACAHRECHGSHQCFFSLAFDTCMVLAAQKAAIPMSRMKARSVLIAGSKTSLRLEEAFWVGLQEIADKRSMTLSGLIGTIDAQRQHGNRSSAVRLFVLEFYRTQVSDANSAISVPNSPPPPASRREPPGS
jgi:predicted DNA-binding ribbon-helix-helix protein